MVADLNAVSGTGVHPGRRLIAPCRDTPRRIGTSWRLLVFRVGDGVADGVGNDGDGTDHAPVAFAGAAEFSVERRVPAVRFGVSKPRDGLRRVRSFRGTSVTDGLAGSRPRFERTGRHRTLAPGPPAANAPLNSQTAVNRGIKYRGDGSPVRLSTSEGAAGNGTLSTQGAGCRDKMYPLQRAGRADRER